jgi:hypothetical protein
MFGLLLAFTLTGCGGAPEEADTSHFGSEKAASEYAAAAEKYKMGGGPGNPNDPASSGSAPSP